MKTLFKYVKASQFFAAYAPGVTMYKHKIRGESGNKTPIDFTDADRKVIKAGVKKMFADIRENDLV